METLVEQLKCDESMITPVRPGGGERGWRICLIGGIENDQAVLETAHKFNVPVVTSETGEELLKDTADWRNCFIFKDFEGPAFQNIRNSKQCIFGPSALASAAEVGNSLVYNVRPIYNFSMKGVVTCFTGIRKKDELIKLVSLIHSMGGVIRKDMNSKITHLISTHSVGDKYQYAKTFRLTIVHPAWVYAAWEKRDELGFLATSKEFSNQYRLKPFEGLKICLHGFPSDEHQHMIDVLTENGGLASELDDPDCSHVVVDEHTTSERPEPKNSRAHIVKRDWFWYTIQNGYADEMDYVLCDNAGSTLQSSNVDYRDSLLISFNKRKRKRLSQRLQLDSTPFCMNKRRSSVSDAGLLSISSSFFDCTTSPDKGENAKRLIVNDVSTCETTPVKKSMRYNLFMDFFTTESNYVGILDTIVNVFKNPLEEAADTSDILLNKSEIKAIFGNFLPIYDAHKSMLEQLNALRSNWSESCLIGDVILEHCDSLTRAYPPYINFFEQMKEMLQQCDTDNARFHAFLKINQSKPECGRQTLQDLMIRPVQRLPSISLLLNDILKYTMKSNPDYVQLEKALKAIKEIMTHINEDKRKTESRMAIFDIFNDIEGCPAHLVSSNRSFISKCDATELSDNLSARGDPLVLYLFSDSIEVCKRRTRAFHSTKSPGSSKLHKHVKLLSLNAIRFVINITDSPRAFALIYRQDKDKLHSFAIVDEEMDKMAYIKILCKQMAENACQTDAEKALLHRTSQEIDIDISDINLSTLSKAFKLAVRTRYKVGRAFSFNKTPSKLKRAVSTMMTSPFGNANSNTPSTQLSQMRLASCTDLQASEPNEMHNVVPTDSATSTVLQVPSSVQLVRKNKSNSLAVIARV